VKLLAPRQKGKTWVGREGTQQLEQSFCAAEAYAKMDTDNRIDIYCMQRTEETSCMPKKM